MTDDNSACVSTSSDEQSLTNENKCSSSWTFNHLTDENNPNDFFSALKKSVAQNVYFNEENNSKNSSSNKINEISTIRVDSSDLISRCRSFLPLLTDSNRDLFSKVESGENVRMELYSDDDNDDDADDDDNQQIIEMNLMFCPNTDLSSETSSDESDDDEQLKSTSLKFVKKKSKADINHPPSISIIDDDNKQFNDSVKE